MVADILSGYNRSLALLFQSCSMLINSQLYGLDRFGIALQAPVQHQLHENRLRVVG